MGGAVRFDQRRKLRARQRVHQVTTANDGPDHDPMRREARADLDHLDLDPLETWLITLRQAAVEDVMDDLLGDSALAPLDDAEDLRERARQAEHPLDDRGIVLAATEIFFENSNALHKLLGPDAEA
jgi:hypothetical protein